MNSVLFSFMVHGFLIRKYIPIYIQHDATLHSLFISGNCSTCFGWYLHPSSGAYIIVFFNVHGSVHRKYILIYIQHDATLHSLFISGNCCTCLGWYFHPSSGAHTTVSTASGTCHTVTATCHYRGGVGRLLHDSGR